jgi:hypothetical protein
MANAVNNNISSSLIPLVAQAPGTLTSTDQQNPSHHGIKVIVDVTAIATANLVVTIQGKDPLSGKVYTLLASAAISATGTTVLTIYPGIAASANATANDILPATWNVKAVVSVGGTVTATIGACLLA